MAVDDGRRGWDEGAEGFPAKAYADSCSLCSLCRVRKAVTTGPEYRGVLIGWGERVAVAAVS
jgi:hypothetical protein